MSTRFLALVCAALLLSPACRSEAPESPEPAPAAAAEDFGGTFRVSGRTIEKGSGRGRDIEGMVVIVQQGDAYTASFDLQTLFPTPDGPPSQAQVVGTGQGSVAGGDLRGTADTQIILAQVPGVDADFGFLPRSYGPRIRSRSSARLDPDGALTIEIESEPAEGQSYQPTRTTLRGTRIATTAAPGS